MELARQSDAEILKVANPIMDNLMAASTAFDHARHVVDFTARLKAIVKKEYLEKRAGSITEPNVSRGLSEILNARLSSSLYDMPS